MRLTGPILAAWLVLPLGPAVATAAPERAPDARDHGDFWAEVLHPSGDQVAAIKVRLREALAIVATDWNPEHRDRVVREATRMARHARQLDPGDPELGFYLGALADEGGRVLEAQRLLTEAARLAPRGPARSEALLRLGKIALRQGAPADAIAPLRQAVAERTDRRLTTAAAVYLAHALDGAGRTADAIDLLAQRVDAATGNWDVEEAMEWLALAVLYDRDEQISMAFAQVVRAQGALSGSYAERLEAALGVAPPVPASEIHYYRGFLYETAGFVHEARSEWQAYLQLPSARHRARARAHLAALEALLAERRPGRRRR